MKDYIEREQAITVFKTFYGKSLRVVLDALREEHAADVREVVLCRDCQNSYEWANVDGDNYRYCGYLRSRWNHDTDRMVDNDDFCKWGRKREES